MTPMEMKEHCLKQIRLCQREGLHAESAEVAFIVPRAWRGQKKMRLINAPKAPWGRPVSYLPPHGTMCFFWAKEVLKWLEENYEV